MGGARLTAKLRVMPIGQAFGDIPALVGAEVIHGWIRRINPPNLDWSAVVLNAGCEEYATRWMREGEQATWKVTVKVPGSGEAQVRHLFVPSGLAKDAPAPEVTEAIAEFVKPVEGSMTAPAEGVLWLSLAASASWYDGGCVALTWDTDPEPGAK